jgi:glycosyltransferase involved in cell wall biosynthesis
MNSPRLSICIATRNRANLIGETLEHLGKQLTGETEVVVVDGASTDNTAEIVEAKRLRFPQIRYCPQSSNSGIDGDFDKAVELANGEYCWPMSDDDLLAQGAVKRVLGLLETNPDVLIVDVEVWSDDFSRLLIERRLPFSGERMYGARDVEKLFVECAQHLTYIGGAIIRRSVWVQRERRPYYGTEFIHFGVIFQAPLNGTVMAVGEPLIRLRYGVASWTSRSFKVWMFTWPALVWSFSHIPESARLKITPREPWHSLRTLLLLRAKGWYSWKEYQASLRPAVGTGRASWLPALVALAPGPLLNTLALVYGFLFARSRKGGFYDLSHSRYYVWGRPHD